MTEQDIATTNDSNNATQQEDTAVTTAATIMHLVPEFPNKPGDDIEFVFVPNLDVPERALEDAFKVAIGDINALIADLDPGTGIELYLLNVQRDGKMTVDLGCPGNKKRRGVSLNNDMDTVCRGLVEDITGAPFDKHPMWLLEATAVALAQRLSEVIPALAETTADGHAIADLLLDIDSDGTAPLDNLSEKVAEAFRDAMGDMLAHLGADTSDALVQAMFEEAMSQMLPKVLVALPDAEDIEEAFRTAVTGSR